MFANKPTVLITGSSGYLGRSLVRTLLNNKKYNIYLLFENINDTITEYPDFDIIVHLAAKVPSSGVTDEEIMETNATAITNLLRHCRSGSHFVFLSSDFVFPSKKDVEYEIHAQKDPSTVYGQSKSIAEDTLLNQNDVNVTIIRTSMLYGYLHPTRNNFLNFLCNKLSNGESIELYEDVYTRPTHVDDLSSFIVKVMQEKIFGTIHACGRDYVSRYDLAKKFSELHNYNSNLLLPISCPENSRFQKFLNMKPCDLFLQESKISLEDGIKNCLQRY